MITYIKGNLFDHIKKDETNIILHICNDRGGWGSGFVMAINKYLGVKPMNSYRSLKHYNLGEIDIVQVNPTTYVVNMIAQSIPGGVDIPLGGGNYIYIPPIRYECLRECLYRVKSILSQATFVNKTINLIGPKFGSGLAGGDFNKISEIINEVGLDINIYEL